MGAHVRLAGPDYDEHVALNPQEEGEPPLFYYKDDPNRDSRSVRGCFLDEIYAKPRLEQKLADLYFDGDVPFMRDNVHCLTDAQWTFWFGKCSRWCVNPGHRGQARAVRPHPRGGHGFHRLVAWLEVGRRQA